MNNLKYLALLILFISCAENNNTEPGKIVVPGNDTIPATRENINKKPVASYIIQMGDPKLDRKFGVEIFETPQTFKYLLVMYYDGSIQNDTLNIPNFGIWPTVKVKPGKEKLSCVIGFLDRKDEFMEYKMLHAKGDQLKLTILKQYGVSTYYR